MGKPHTKIIYFNEETKKEAQWLTDNGYNLSKLVRDFILDKSRKERAYRELEKQNEQPNQ